MKDIFVSYLKNDKLIYLYNEISKAGIQICLSEYTPEIAYDSLCRTSFVGNNTWSLSLINNPNICDSLICHELMHFVVIFEGIPFITYNGIVANSYEDYLVNFLNNMVHHLLVWDLNKKYGFSEDDRFDNEVKTRLIQRASQIHSFLRPGISFRSPSHSDLLYQEFCYILNGLLGPCKEETKKILLDTVQASCPQLVPLIGRALDQYRNSLPLTPETAQVYLWELTTPIVFQAIPPTFVYPLPKITGFADRILNN